MTALDQLLDNRKKLRPFVGAGATAAVADKNTPASSWNRLLEAGIEECVKNQPQLQNTDWATLLKARIPAADAYTYMAIGDEISRRIDGQQWDAWIRDTVGSISVPGSTLHASICKFDRVVLTTNYDRVLEEASGTHATLHWKDENLADSVGETSANFVVHLHGVATSPESVVLGSWQYQALTEAKSAQFWQGALLGSKNLLFIGCGTGLTDPNIGPALDFIKVLQGDKPMWHFRLVRGVDLKAANEEYQVSKVAVPVAYGHGYNELEPFLTALENGSLEAGTYTKPGQDFREYEEVGSVQEQHRTSPSRSKNSPAEEHPPSNRPPGLLDLAGPAEVAIQRALDLGHRTVRTAEQLERRSTLPHGINEWLPSDQSEVHNRIAGSAAATAERLSDQIQKFAEAVVVADVAIAHLPTNSDNRLGILPGFVAELTDLCEESRSRLAAQLSEFADRSRLMREYGFVHDTLRKASYVVPDAPMTSLGR